ncbi:MAG: hypothetical protein JWO19_4214 [Bryobacterales bacterium]|nr:hypothetical protein [Bryobacterales bacterium]
MTQRDRRIDAAEHAAPGTLHNRYQDHKREFPINIRVAEKRLEQGFGEGLPGGENHRDRAHRHKPRRDPEEYRASRNRGERGTSAADCGARSARL